MTDFRALCIELTDCLEKADWPLRYRYVFRQWVDIARAALADEPAMPAPPADGEVADVVRWLKSRAGIPASPDFPAVAAYLTRAAELLQRQALVPVSVSERLPGPSDCAPWPKDSDASAWCWVGTDEDGGWEWEQRSAGCLVMFPDSFTHWLPAHALPLPEVEGTNG